MALLNEFCRQDKTIGGAGKTSRQIWGVKKAYVLKDDVESGGGNIIPLWLIGFVE